MTDLFLWAVPKKPPVALVTALSLPGTSGNYVSAPDSAGLSITGDLELRIDCAADDWTPAATQDLIGKGSNDYTLQLLDSGSLRLIVGGGFGFADSTIAPTVGNGAFIQLRVTKSGSTVLYYTRATKTDLTSNSGWTALGSGPSFVGSDTVPDTTDAAVIGADTSGTQRIFAGKVRRAIFMSGITGSVAGDFNPGAVTVLGTRNPSTYNDGTNTWTVNGSAWDWISS